MGPLYDALILFVVVFIISRLVGYTPSESVGCGGTSAGIGFVLAIVPPSL